MGNGAIFNVGSRPGGRTSSKVRVSCFRSPSPPTLLAAVFALVGAILTTVTSSEAAGTGSGVVIYTTLDNGRDETAIAVPFVKIEQFALVTNFTTTNGKSIRVKKNMLKEIIRPLDLSHATVVDEAGLQSLKSEAQALRSIQAKYPQAKGALESIIGEIERAAQSIESGNVLHEGHIMARADYEGRVMASRSKPIDITLNGRAYTGARLKSVGSGKASITHAGGVASIQVSQLSAEQIALLNQTSDTSQIASEKPAEPLVSITTTREAPMQATLPPKETPPPIPASESPDATSPIAPASADAAPSIDETLSEFATRSLAPLRQQAIKSVAMTYIFHNGSRETPFSNFIKRKLTTQLLVEAGGEINLIDRQDFKLQHAEQSFSFTFTSDGQALSDPEPVDAIVVGEVVTSLSVGEFLLHLRAIDLKSSRLLSATTVTVAIDTAIAERLGISEIDLPVLPPLPTLTSDLNTATKSLASGFKPDQVLCCLDDPANIDGKDNLLQRLTRSQLTSTLVANGWQILERELFYLVARDQGATGAGSEDYLTGEIILSLSEDDTAPKNSPTFFVKAIQTDNGRLVGQAEMNFAALAKKPNPEAAGNSTTGLVMGGGDQSLADALRRTQEKSAVSKGDPLIFTASTVLGETLKPKPETLARIGKCIILANESASTPALFHLQETRTDAFDWWFSADKNNQKFKKGFPKSQMVEDSLFRLNAIESGDIEAVKADLIAFLFWGYGIEYRNGNSVVNPVHIGPLLDVTVEIYTTYSLYPDGRSSVREWLSILSIRKWGGFGASSFSSRLLLSLHPQEKLELITNLHATPLEFPRGTYRFNPDDLNHLGDSDIAKNVSFDYNLESVWKEAFPSTLKATIDLTPMKDHLYKIKK